MSDTPNWFDILLASKAPTTQTAEALKVIEQNRHYLEGLGEVGFASVMTQMAGGNWDKAVEVYLIYHASLDELLAASRQTTVDLLEAHRQAEENRKKILQILMNIGILTAKFILPLLIAAI